MRQSAFCDAVLAAVTNIHKYVQCMWVFCKAVLAGAGKKNAIWALHEAMLVGIVAYGPWLASFLNGHSM